MRRLRKNRDQDAVRELIAQHAAGNHQTIINTILRRYIETIQDELK